MADKDDVKVTFQILAQTQWGESVAIFGSTDKLGTHKEY